MKRLLFLTLQAFVFVSSIFVVMGSPLVIRTAELVNTLQIAFPERSSHLAVALVADAGLACPSVLCGTRKFAPLALLTLLISGARLMRARRPGVSTGFGRIECGLTTAGLVLLVLGLNGPFVQMLDPFVAAASVGKVPGTLGISTLLLSLAFWLTEVRTWILFFRKPGACTPRQPGCPRA